ncbi:SWI/SNF complex subunit SWI3C-like [Aristolochia californica]|uniref:SWI/SNF complex subunit SWI3C-like n=1 Tax=Aristolochia californica TaxID=171875 RepID=UPI0035E321CB
MAPSPSFPSDSRLKWKKRKRESNLKTPTKKQKPYQDEEDDDEDEEDETAIEYDDTNDENEQNDSPAAALAVDTVSKQIEVLADTAVRVSSFPLVIRHAVNRPHSSVLSLVAADRDDSRSQTLQNFTCLENISQGQLQVVSVIPPDSPCLGAADPDRSDGNAAAFVCTPPAIMEGRGVIKKFGNRGPLVVPMHADWFSPKTIHRLERQVVPHFFAGKSNDHTPERYMEIRNRIVSKYLESPGMRISPAGCQALVGGFEVHDINRIARFLDHWGIINYMAAPLQPQSKVVGPVIQEEANGDLQVSSVALKSIDSLIHFDKPKSRYRLEDVYSVPSVSVDVGASDLDGRIRERLSENHCNFCSKALLHSFYQSHKEVDITLCSECFHDGKLVAGHASIDFIRVDSMRDYSELEGDNWTDQETLLLLQALEIYHDSWNEIADLVGTKTKAQCIQHFISLPMEDGLLENIELPVSSNASSDSKNQLSNGNCDIQGTSSKVLDHENKIPFESSGNPVMALVAFLASAVGPRVAAACAHASLTSLSKDDSSQHEEDSAHGDRGNSESLCLNEDAFPALSREKVKAAAKFGLSAAAMKAKLFSDHEEREMQRLAATIINHKLKRLELKLKQFTELETVLLKECEQVESTRQRLSAERTHFLSTRFGQAAGLSSVPAVSAASNTSTNNQNTSSNRQPVISTIVNPPNISAFSSSQPTHPHMSFMPRQQMFPFAQRMPVSMVPFSSGSTSTGMFPSGSANASPLTPPMLRPVSGTNTNQS